MKHATKILLSIMLYNLSWCAPNMRQAGIAVVETTVSTIASAPLALARGGISIGRALINTASSSGTKSPKPITVKPEQIYILINEMKLDQLLTITKDGQLGQVKLVENSIYPIQFSNAPTTYGLLNGLIRSQSKAKNLEFDPVLASVMMKTLADVTEDPNIYAQVNTMLDAIKVYRQTQDTNADPEQNKQVKLYKSLFQ